MKNYVTEFRACLIACAMVVGAASTDAAIVYVDATHGSAGNTAVAPSAGGGVFTPLAAQGPAGDGLWDVRAFANSATIYQNAGFGATDNAQRLVTSVSVPSATYDVFGYFWVDTSDWRLGASFVDEAGNLPLFTRNSPGVVQFYAGADATVLSSSLASNPFTSEVMIAQGNRRLFQAPLGQVTGSTISVFIDDDPLMADGNQRTWYDGIGYDRVPEPASLIMLLVGVAIPASSRRRD